MNDDTKKILQEIMEELFQLLLKAEAVCDEGHEPLFSIEQAYKQAKFRVNNPNHIAGTVHPLVLIPDSGMINPYSSKNRKQS